MADSIPNFTNFGYHSVIIDVHTYFCNSCSEPHYNSSVTFVLDDGEESEDMSTVSIFTDTFKDSAEECAIETFYSLVRTFNYIEERVCLLDKSGNQISEFKLSDLIVGNRTIN